MFILVQIKHALCQTNMLKKIDKIHNHINKFASNMYKLNKDINMVYKSLVHKIIYHVTNHKDSNKLHECSKLDKMINYNN